MGKRAVILLPKMQKILEQMGEQIKLARLRRDISTELVAERAGISRATLWKVEKEVRPLRSEYMPPFYTL